MCARFAFPSIPAMSRLNVYVEPSFDMSRILTEIGLLADYTFFTEVPGRKKCSLAPVSTMEYCLDICITDVEFAVSICLLVRLLMMIVLSSSSSFVASGKNLFVVLFVVRYNKLVVVGYRFFKSI